MFLTEFEMKNGSSFPGLIKHSDNQGNSNSRGHHFISVDRIFRYSGFDNQHVTVFTNIFANTPMFVPGLIHTQTHILSHIPPPPPHTHTQYGIVCYNRAKELYIPLIYNTTRQNYLECLFWFIVSTFLFYFHRLLFTRVSSDSVESMTALIMGW